VITDDGALAPVLATRPRKLQVEKVSHIGDGSYGNCWQMGRKDIGPIWRWLWQM